MKNINILLAAFCMSLMLSSVALATDNETSNISSIELTDGLTTPSELTLNFSPGVVG